MRKKVLYFLTMIILLFSSAGLFACKGKYDEMGFRIYYSFDANGEDWQDGTSGIDYFFNEDLQNNQAKIYLKIDVLNVAKKDLDSIIVSNLTYSNGVSFDSKIVKENEVFSIEFTQMASITLKVLETNSQKSTTFDINVSRALTNIEADLSTKPAVVVGSSLNLATIKNEILTFYPVGTDGNSLTLQTGVDFAIKSVGSFDQAKQYNPSSQVVQSSVAYISNSILYVNNGFNFSTSSYAIEIEAKSVDNLELEPVKFYVYVVPNSDFSPTIKFLNNTTPKDLKITLYPNSNYSAVKLSVNSIYNGPYVSGLRTADGEFAQINIKAFLPSSLQDIEYGETIASAGLMVSNEEGNTFSISSTNNSLLSDFKIGFKTEIVGLDYLNLSSSYNNNSIVELNKVQLPRNLTINESVFNVDTQDKTYNLTINSVNGQQIPSSMAVSLDSPLQKIEIVGHNDFKILPNPSNNLISSGTTLNVTFANDSTTEGSFSLKFRTNPEEFQGESLPAQETTILIRATKSISADGFAIYKNKSHDPLNANKKLDVALNSSKNQFFLRVYYTRQGSFAFNSVNLLSQSDAVKFSATNDVNLNLTQLSFVSSGVEEQGQFSGKAYYDYQINLSRIDSMLECGISIVAANGYIKSNFVVSPKRISEGNYSVQQTIETTDAFYVSDVANGHENFAIQFNKTVNFKIADSSNLGNEEETINTVTFSKITENSANFSDNAIRFSKDSVLKSIFNITSAQANKTQIIQLDIQYYSFVSDSDGTGYVEIKTKTIVLEFAVYLPIDNIELELDADFDALTYISSPYQIDSTKRYNSATIKYSSSSKFGVEPSTEIHFSGANTKTGINKLELTFSHSLENLKFISLKEKDNQINTAQPIYLNSHSGEVEIYLNAPPQINYLDLSFTSISFGTKLDEVKTTRVHFQNCAKAENVEIKGNDISVQTNGQNLISISYIKNNIVSKKFTASAVYPTSSINSFKLYLLGYQLYKASFENDLATFNPISSDFGITVNFLDDNQVSLTATNTLSKNGGYYRLDIFAVDSYDATTQKYSAINQVYLRISDGTKENPYSIASAEDFENFANNPQGNFNLTNDIEISNIVVKNFEGCLSGASQVVDEDGRVYVEKHTLTAHLGAENLTSDEKDYYFGIFQKLSNSSAIENLNLVLYFDLISNLTTNTDTKLYFGGLVARNSGRISNISVSTSNQNLTLNLTEPATEVCFGLIAGENSGNIDLLEASVSAQKLSLNLSQNSGYNIGLLVGENNGQIVGNYLGKSSLNSIAYSAIADFAININNNSASINVGGIAGSNTRGITNVIIGGKIELNGSATTANLGGIVGKSDCSEVSLSTKGIHTCAVLGLDLTNNVELGAVAGIVANSSSTDIYDVKVISTQVRFFNEELKTSGRIYGKAVVAGIIANSNSDTIESATLENFISKVENETGVDDFYTLNSNSNQIATFIYSGNNSKISTSFANINLFNTGTNKLILTSPTGTSETATYFIGKIKDFDANSTQLELNPSSTYVVVYSQEKFWYKQDSALKEFSQFEIVQIMPTITTENTEHLLKQGGDLNYYWCDEWQSDETYYAITDYDVDSLYIKDQHGDYVLLTEVESFDIFADEIYLKKDWEDFVKSNLTNLNWSEDNTASFEELEKVALKLDSGENEIIVSENHFYFPYLVVDGKQLRIAQPTEIEAKFNADYAIYINSIIYSDDINFEEDYTKYNLQEILFVNFYEYDGINKNTDSYNTHYLVNKLRDLDGKQEYSGLLNLPNSNSTDGGVSFEIVLGDNAYLTTDGERIVFTSVSNSPIILRAYSIFNPSAEYYVAFIVQHGLSEVVLKSNSALLIKSPESSGQDDGENNVDYELSLYTSSTAVSIDVSAENIFKAEKFKTIFDSAIAEYLTIQATANEKSPLSVDLVGKTIKISLENNTSLEAESTITITLQLNLSVFGLTGNLNLGTLKLLVLIYRTTEKIEVFDVATTADSESYVNFDVNLITGYNYSQNSGTILNPIIDGNSVTLLDNSDKTESIDTLVLSFRDSLKYGNNLIDLLNKTEVDYVPQLFNFIISYKKIDGGYKYSISISLKDEFNFRYLQGNVGMLINITSTTNKTQEIAKDIEITFTPTQFQSARFYNYSAINYDASATSIIKRNSIDTSFISPSGYGSIMVIHLEPEYANVVSATLTSNSVDVPSAKQPVSLIYTQLIRTGTGENVSYSAIPFANERVDGGIKLEPYSSFDSETGNMSYDGIIYIHVMVSENFSGYSTTLTSTLSVDIGEEQPIVRQKLLTTEFIPGVTLSYDDNAHLTGNEYLVQEDTVSNVSITLYGYELNNTPTISLVWDLPENGKFKYGTTNGAEDRTIIVDKENVKYNIKDWVNYSSLKDYTDLVANADGSYTFVFKIYVREGIPASFKLIAELKVNNEQQTKELVFHPTKYFINSVYIKNLNNNRLSTIINAHNRLDFGFTTNNPNNDLSNAIYDAIIKGFNNDLSKLAHLFSFTMGDVSGRFDSEVEQFLILFGNNHLYFTGLTEAEINVNLQLGYSYKEDEQTGRYEIQFGSSEHEGDLGKQYSFNIIVRSGTTEDAPISISSEADFKKLSTAVGGDYILMNDIDLYDYEPISAQFASLDGNNKVIRIHNFATNTTRMEYGLFASVGTYNDVESSTPKATSLKNIIVDYGEFQTLYVNKTESITSLTFGGLVATLNAGGIVYNCDVMNLSSNVKTINLVLNGFVGSEVVFGGLVGTNSGVITNSRVGRENYLKISLDEVVNLDPVIVQIDANPLSFVLGNSTASQDDAANGFIGVAAGFVGRNNSNGIVATSYVANTSLYNYSTREDETNLTAGFVAENDGNIRYSYVKAIESTISFDDSSVNSTGAYICSMGNGNVAGFVYNNNGHITNCFANTELQTDSGLISGFVYRNNAGAVVDTSYSACTLNVRNQENNSYAEQPFVGVDEAQVLLSFGEIVNCYYLDEEGSLNKVKAEDNKPNAHPLFKENFKSRNNLSGFVFINSDKRKESDLGVWSYYYKDTAYQHTLPELTSANKIAYSYRYLSNQETNVFQYAPSFEPGTENNPFIIRSAEEFNIVMTGTDGNDDLAVKENSRTGFIRVINDISFTDENSGKVSILTRANFTLGDKYNPDNITSIEGNGMSISGIYLDVLELLDEASNRLNKVGLFAEIYNTYIKNINLEFEKAEFAEENLTIPIKYSGGLAGTIENGTLINMDLIGNETTLAGRNFVGGVAGLISGNSLLYDINVNLNVISDSSINDSGTISGIYYSEQDFNRMQSLGYFNSQEFNTYDSYLNSLSFAGGLAGVLDLNNRNNNENVSNITVRADQMPSRTYGNIVARYAGGVAGYANSNTSAFRLKVYVGNDTKIYGTKAVGGIFGVGLGSLSVSQVTAMESDQNQYFYDTNFANYIKNLPAPFDGEMGNTRLLRSQGYAGGLVGISIAQTIENNYAKASLDLAETFGGLLGLSLGSKINYSYAVPYVNLDNATIKNVGGLIGIALSIQNDGSGFDEYVTYARDVLHNPVPKYTNLNYTFSTILLDNDRLSQIIDGQVEDSSINTAVNINEKNINYLVADFQTNNICHVQSNDKPLTSGSTLNVFVGKVNGYAKTNGEDGDDVIKYNYGDMFELYKLYETEKSSQAELFRQLFGDWPEYWDLNESRYYPLLIQEEGANYIKIEKWEDFEYLVDNQYGTFKVTKDIDMSNWQSNSNWIFNINFQGSLIGDLGNDSTALPRVYNLHLDTQFDNASAGLFRSTTNALIKNIEFIWAPQEATTIDDSAAINIQNSITIVGGLSCEDNNSNFNNVDVSVGGYDATSKKITPYNNYYLIDNSSYHPINGFGGLVGEGENTVINSCSFKGKVRATLNNTQTEDVYFGALVGKGKKSIESMTDFQPKFLVMQSNVGDINGFTTDFDITLNQYNNAYLGGAIGYAQDGAISSIRTGNAENSNNKSVNLTVNLPNLGQIYLGGLVGYAENSSISSCETINGININGTNANTETTNTGSGSLYAAGLVGRFLGVEDVINTYVETDIKLYPTTIANAYLSGGIAEISTTGTINLMQNVFKGNINTEIEIETEDENAPKPPKHISKICAGGVVANQTSNLEHAGILAINQCFVEVNMIIEMPEISVENNNPLAKEYPYYVGGIVGLASGKVQITDAITAGRIVPITAEYSEAYIGGVVGMAENVDLTNLISTTSIIMDGLYPSGIKNACINAIFGKVDAYTINSVYYSSDISLCPELVCSEAVNISANALTHPSLDLSWQQPLIASNNWLQLEGQMPYLCNITNYLTKYGILLYNNANEIGNYKQGSSTSPTLVGVSAEFTPSSEFSYYLLDIASDDTILPFLTSNLNGVLIGGECTYTVDKQIISQINTHSAVSNLHIVIEDDAEVELTTETNACGFIANDNQGVIFNCSVNGAGIKLTGASYVGLIAGQNDGLISYSFSSAEIVSAAASSNLGGICFNNNGKILSSYFTGYIDLTSYAAGIAYYLNGGSYIYNSYMAGVVNFTDNAFASVSLKGKGSHNYIDINVNKNFIKQETKIDDITETNLETVETQLLMANDASLLKGNWFVTTASTEDGQYYVDITSNTYGYNYLYPIYDFNKYNGQMNEIVYNYSLYTGTGYTNRSISVNDSEGVQKKLNFDDISSLVGDDENRTLYTDALKVPHLGVLKAIQGIANTLIGADKTPIKTKLNYVLIYDIDGQYFDLLETKWYSWTAVGSSEESEKSFYYTDAEFNGFFISNKYYNFTPLNEFDATTSNLCTIKNLSGQGLFTNVSNAYIGYVIIGDMYELENSGAVAKNIKSGEVYVKNLYFAYNTTISGFQEGENYLAGFFGVVEDGASITITYSGFTQESSNYVTISGGTTAGLVAAKVNGGTISFVDGNNLRVAFNSVNYAGGLVGELVNGKIIGNGTATKSAVHIVNRLYANAYYLGGIVGKISKAQDIESSSISISNIIAYLPTSINLTGFGGLAYQLQNTTATFKNCAISLETGNTFTPTLANDNMYFGLVCGNIVNEEGSETKLNVYALLLPENDFTIDIKTSTSTEANTGIGALVGHENGGKLNLELINSRSVKATLKATTATNVGGMVGKFEAGQIAIEQSFANKFSVDLYGLKNVGGAIGYCLANATTIIDEFDSENNVEQTPAWNFLNAVRAYATLKTVEELDNSYSVEFSNWGGLFGYYLNEQLGDDDTQIVNYNTIEIKSVQINNFDDPLVTNPKLSNVGGVAGRAKSGKEDTQITVLNVQNNGGIVASENNLEKFGLDSENEVFEIFAKYKDYEATGLNYMSVLPINVGGLFGQLTNGTLSGGAVGASSILGYENVGGLVGLATNVQISNSKVASGTIYGVLNVGGAVGEMNGISIAGSSSVAAVYGNYNVGGLVGYVANGTVDGSQVGSGEGAKTEIKGVYLKTYNYIEITLTESSTEAGLFNRAAFFFPTNVGGLIGSTANSTNEGTQIQLTNNNVSNVLVSSSKEGYLNEYDEKDSKKLVKTFNSALTISTVKNAMLNLGASFTQNRTFNLQQLVTSDDYTISESYLTAFNDTASGFGGLVGATDAASALENIATNSMSSVEVYAMLGINTGAIFGAYNANTEVTDNIVIKTPKLMTNLYVEGAYQVGGIAGYIYSPNDMIKFDTATGSDFVSFGGDDATTIYVQSHPYSEDTPKEDITGIYVGGLFGKLHGTADGMKINGDGLKIDMTTTNAYYAGGLIGRLEGNLGNENSTTNSNIINGKPANGTDFTAPDDAPFTIHGDDKENFGGLVGMLKVRENEGGTTAYVIGWQPYAFTVNTIENSNYADGETTYDYDDSDSNDLYLIAQAYYVNQDTFNISYSRGARANGKVGDDVNTTAVTTTNNKVIFGNSAWFNNWANNPLIEEGSFGWARDYTMFKTMQRNIPQSNNNGAAWDSISVVYDASRITYVATVNNSFRGKPNSTDTSGMGNRYGTNDGGWYDSNLGLHDSTNSSSESENLIYSMSKSSNNYKLESLAEHYADDGDEGFDGTVDKKKDERGHYVITKRKEDFNNHIFFTIYEGDENHPQLYSRVGVAKLLRDNNNKVVTDASQIPTEVHEYEDGEYGNYYIDLSGQQELKNDNIGDSFSGDIKDTFVKTFDKTNKALSYFYWFYKSNKNGTEIKSILEGTYLTTQAKVGDEEKSDFRTDMVLATIKDNNNTIGESKKHYVYSVPNTLYGEKVYFEFFNMFQNFSANSQDASSAFSDNDISPDGSIYNVSGLISEAAIDNLLIDIQPDDTDWLGWLITSIIFLALAIVATALSGGSLGPLFLGLAVTFIIGYMGSAVATIVTGIMQGIENSEAAKLIAQDVAAKRKSLSYGFVTSTYDRSVNYIKDSSGRYIMQTANDDYRTDGGEIYYYFSSTRPTDYYDHYYLHLNITKENDETIVSNPEMLSKYDSRIETDANGNVEKFGGNEVNNTNGDGDRIANTYIFKYGAYYVNAFAGETKYEAHQLKPNFDDNNPTQYYQADNGLYYAQGTFENETYILDKDKDVMNNNLYLDGDTVKNKLNTNWSGIEKDSFASQPFEWKKNSVKFVPTSDVGEKDSTATYQKEGDHLIATNITKGNPNIYLGYGYMQGVYYTANGNDIGIGNKVGKFTYKGYEGNYTPTGTYGIDYITRQYQYKVPNPDGESPQIVDGPTLYYVFDGGYSGSDSSSDMDKVGTYNGGENAQPQINSDTLYINLYPSTFKNPYQNQTYKDQNNQDKDIKEIAYDKSQYFIESGVAGSEENAIEFDVIYYYYDGGYVVGNYNQDELKLDDNGNGLVFLKVNLNEIVTSTNTKRGETPLILYDKFGNQFGPIITKESFTLGGVSPGWTTEQQTLDYNFLLANYNGKINGTEIKDLYVADVHESFRKNEDGSYDTDNDTLLTARYKVRNYYKVVGENLYIVDNNFTVYEGILSRLSVVNPTANDEDYNRNKYLINRDLQIYTRYKFTEGKIPYSDGDPKGNENLFNHNGLGWVNSNKGYIYYLFNNNPNNQANPNFNKTTYLTESLLVTLGGGKNVKTSTSGTASTRSGSFNAK